MEWLNDVLHSNAGMHKYRPFVKARIDAFYEYLPSDDEKDQEVIARLGSTVVDLADMCFTACVDPLHKYYTYTEKVCVTDCARGYFGGFEQVVLETNAAIKQERKLAEQLKREQEQSEAFE